MAIFNLDNMRELYSENTDMSLDEAFEVLDDFLNEGSDANRNFEKSYKKLARNRAMHGNGSDDMEDAIYYAREANKRHENHKSNTNDLETKSFAKGFKHGFTQAAKIEAEDPEIYEAIRKARTDNSPKKEAGNSDKNKEIIKANLKAKGKLKEACLTILEALENYEED